MLLKVNLLTLKRASFTNDQNAFTRAVCEHKHMHNNNHKILYVYGNVSPRAGDAH